MTPAGAEHPTPAGEARPLPAVPFARALVPTVARALDAVARSRPGRDDVLTTRACTDLAVRLYGELARATSPVLLDRFVDRPDRRPFIDGARAACEAFESELCGEGFDEIIAADPGREHTMRLLADRWIAATGRLIDALESDHEVLRDRFALHVPCRSARRRDDTVTRVEDHDGTVVVFKDRRVATEVAFAGLVSWFNALGPSLDLRAPAAVDRGEHGWVEHVEHRAPDDAERPRYLRRVGMLLALAHALGGGDLHDANLLACGEHPVVVDAEKLLRPAWDGVEDTPSVGDTMVLPGPGTYARCGLANEVYVERPRRWVHVGTDAVRQRPIGSWLADTDDAVRHHLRHDRDHTVAALGAGFDEAYRLVQANPIPLDLFDDVRVRVLLRTSLAYDELIERGLEPGGAAAAERRSAVDAFVAVPPRRIEPDHPTAAAIAAAERDALLGLAVPRFWCRARSRAIGAGDRELGPLFAASPLERAARLGRMLGDAHRDAQLDAIAASFHTLDDGATQRPTYRFTRIDLGSVVS